KLVLTAQNPVKLLVLHQGSDAPQEVSVDLAGAPSRLGITWRVDDAEPGAVALVRVLPASAADAAGLKLNDRIYSVSGQRFATSDEFRKLIQTLPGPLDLEMERDGQIRHVQVVTE